MKFNLLSLLFMTLLAMVPQSAAKVCYLAPLDVDFCHGKYYGSQYLVKEESYIHCAGYYTLVAMPKKNKPKTGKICVADKDYSGVFVNGDEVFYASVRWEGGKRCERTNKVEIHAYTKKQLKEMNDYINALKQHGDYVYVVAGPSQKKDLCF